jgi:serine/threonine protein kinase/tetratricopeptide (TPR) repeat protein
MGMTFPNVEIIFEEASEIASAGERARFLDRVCAGNAELRRQVETLLGAHFRAGQFLESPAASRTLTVEPAPLSEGPGATIGPYKLLEEIGEGGMGVVYMAEQTRPVRRKVALKIIKPGMDTKQVVARFEAERQALALMDHPNIARVLDAGATDTGRPYFVMELVRGIPITDYCDRAKLPISDRLSLFTQVCQAVQHAHQKGIIHRDLKPSNVLVTMIDGAAVPKVIDFGVAKAMGQQLTEKTLFTGFAQLLGTPLYMSPEQAEFSGVDVDTRSDIYSMGVLLYELLTGTTPFDQETFRKAAFDEIRRMIREQEPPKPSTRLSTLHETLATVSSNRGSEPGKLARSLRGELDWIVMKCLEKDRARRYESASGLVADLHRHLNHEPVEACSPSAWYRMRKFAQRNRAALVTAAVVATVLVVGTAVSTWAALRAINAERLAQTRLEGERTARGEADRLLGEVTNERNQANLARQEADQSAAEAKAVVAFVVDDVLGAAAPSKTHGKAVTVLESLANADRALEGKFANEPRVEASVRESLAKVYEELDEYEKAEAHASRALALREKSLGPEHEATLSAMNTLGWSLCLVWAEDKCEQAEALFRRMLEICHRTRKDDDELILSAMTGLAESLGRQAYIHGDTVTGLAAILRRGRQLDEAADLCQRVLDAQRTRKGPRDPKTFNALINLANNKLMYPERLQEAEPLLRGIVLANVKDKPDDLSTLGYMSDYASLLSRLSRIGEAADWAVRSMNAHLRVLKLKHPRTVGAVAMAMDMKIIDQKFEEALAIADRALEQSRREFGPDDLMTVDFLEWRVGVLLRLGDLGQAGKGAAEVLAARARKLGPEDSRVVFALANLADIRRHQGATDEARALFAQLHDASQRVLDSLKKQGNAGVDRTLRAEIKWAEVLACTLGRPGRSDRSELPPGTPGGPPRIDAPFQTRSPVADGRIEPGEYGDGNGFSFDFSNDPNPGGSYLGIDETTSPQRIKDPSDLSVQMHTVHTAAALFLAFRVRDQSVRATPAAAHQPWLNDCVEVYLDGDRVANDFTPIRGEGNREGFRIGSDPLGNRFMGTPEVNNPLLKVGASRTEDGYVIEFEVPLHLIDTQDGPGFRPATTGSELRMNVSILDYDDPVNELPAYGVLWSEDRQWSLGHGGEDFWAATVRLTPTPTSVGMTMALPASVFAPP